MERKKTFTMNWDSLGDHDDDDDHFFESFDRLSTVVPTDLAYADDEDDFYDPRSSYASAISPAEFRSYSTVAAAANSAEDDPEDYNIWMAGPEMSIMERRRRLLQDMGLTSQKKSMRIANKDLTAMPSKKVNDFNASNTTNPTNPDSNGVLVNGSKHEPLPSNGVVANGSEFESSPSRSPSRQVQQPVSAVLVRSRSESEIEAYSRDKQRKEEMLGLVSKQGLTRRLSMIIVSQARICANGAVTTPMTDVFNGTSSETQKHNKTLTSVSSTKNNGLGAFFLIKNLDTGKEFIVNEYDQDGQWNRVSDLQTGKQLTLEEFEKTVGHSPVVKELMRRENVNKGNDNEDDYDEGNERKLTANSYLSKSLRMSKKRGAAFLKNIKGVAHSISTPKVVEKEKENPATADSKMGKNTSASGWIKVRQTGKNCKELSALHLCQEIQAHEGSIWTMKFSTDVRFLASGGEDKVINVYEVQECELMSMPEGNSMTPIHPSLCNSIQNLGDGPSIANEKKKKGKKGSSGRKGSSIPEYVHPPETVFSLSEKPICSFTGHLDDVLDLSWSRSQLLLSSSMDKTVRLWDVETKTCLKMFAHNDYVTCIHFNPMDDDYFISGSLDNKVRIWRIHDRKLVDWADIHEMITAVCFTPDGQGALVGSHKGSCRMYTLEVGDLDCKLDQENVTEIGKKMAHEKKITGFQFSPVNPSEVLVTSADSRMRILDGQDIVHKFKGFRNINSQIAASFSLDGKYVICASEDSNVYVWKREEPRRGNSKAKTVVNCRSHEHFPCKDVSVAIPWPGIVKGDPPLMQSKGNSKRSGTSSLPLSANNSPTKEDAAAANGKTHLPPLPKKNKNNIERSHTPSEEDILAQISRSDSTAGESFSSNSSAITHDDSPSISSASNPSSAGMSSRSWMEGGGHENLGVQTTAWGLVIVTATLGGEIRVYQNFGLPRKIGRQTNLF